MAKYQATQLAKVWMFLVGATPSYHIDSIQIGETVEGRDLANGYLRLLDGYTKKSWFRLISETPIEPPPTSAPGAMWVVRGDEELARFNYQSRTLSPDWAYLPQTPSVFRFDREANTPDLYKVNILPLRGEIFRVNGWTEEDNKSAYLFSGGTALFNGNSYPRQTYLTMSFNLLEEIAVEGNYLKFKTVKPTDNVSHMARDSHPQFVHKWDIVSARKIPDTKPAQYETFHTNTPHGEMYWFLCSAEGFGYVPLEIVRRR